MKTFKFLLIAIIFFVVGFFLGQSYQLPSTVTAPIDQTQFNKLVIYSIQFSNVEMTEFQNIQLIENQTVLDLLQNLTLENNIVLETKEYENLGALVTKIGDKENGQDNKYWQYWINGEMPQVGASYYQLTGGEIVEWKFLEFEEDTF